MPSMSVFGAQWGDEGKGKIIDLLAADADVVVRYQGGANAGHTVVVGEEKYILHLIPSGILHPGKVNVIAGGVALDPLTLLDEIDGLVERGVQIESSNLRLASNAHVIFEHHRLLDHLAESSRGSDRIGTTGRGIGPCYADKAGRTGLRIADLLDPRICRERLTQTLELKNKWIVDVHRAEPIDPENYISRYLAVGERLRPFVTDTGAEVRAAYAAGKHVLFEGAQGVMRGLDLGSYPYVTSSNTGVGALSAAAAFPPQKLERAIGIAKAYCTRVGEGPFPSEFSGERAERLREAGNEYGATTGRPRRCGALDTVALRYTLEVSGAAGWVMTNLDVLTGFETIDVAVGYRRGGETWTEFPAHLASFDGIEVELASLPGWTEDISQVRSYDDLPPKARAYVEWIEERVGVPVCMLSVGPEREQVISRGLE